MTHHLRKGRCRAMLLYLELSSFTLIYIFKKENKTKRVAQLIYIYLFIGQSMHYEKYTRETKQSLYINSSEHIIIIRCRLIGKIENITEFLVKNSSLFFIGNKCSEVIVGVATK